MAWVFRWFGEQQLNGSVDLLCDRRSTEVCGQRSVVECDQRSSLVIFVSDCVGMGSAVTDQRSWSLGALMIVLGLDK